MPIPLEVRFDDYTTDIVENQLLRTAIRRMMAVPRLTASARERLAIQDQRLMAVRILPSGVPTSAWNPSRLNARYGAALRLAELVLANQSAEPGPGDVSLAAFVVNMSTVFENFVTTAIREALTAYPGETEQQYRAYLDEGQSIPIRPDLVRLVDGRPAAVFDAKYKLEHPTAGFVNGDTYQMLAYCTALNVRAGWLVYAKGRSAPEPKRVRNAGIDIIHHPLDLEANPHVILRDLEALVRKAAAVAPR